jgi:hypothetical protein
MSKFVRKFSLVLCGERIDDLYMKELCKSVSYSVVSMRSILRVMGPCPFCFLASGV